MWPVGHSLLTWLLDSPGHIDKRTSCAGLSPQQLALKCGWAAQDLPVRCSREGPACLQGLKRFQAYQIPTPDSTNYTTKAGIKRDKVLLTALHFHQLR